MNSQVSSPHGLWVVIDVFGRLLAGPATLLDALHRAFEISAQTASLSHAPSQLINVGADDRIEAEGIVSLWRQLGWLPSSR